MGDFKVPCPVCGGKSRRVKSFGFRRDEVVYRCENDNEPYCGHVGLYRFETPELTIQRSEQLNPFCKRLSFALPEKFGFLTFLRSLSPAGAPPVHDVQHPNLEFKKIHPAAQQVELSLMLSIRSE